MLVLSLFPGIGLLDMAFEEEGFTIVRGPDLLWGGDIRRFHPPAGKFDGVIGGPPCQAHSTLRHLVEAVHGSEAVAEDLIPEFERCVRDAQPGWFLMENVRGAPVPIVAGYTVDPKLINNRWCGGTQNRLRRFSFGTRSFLCPRVAEGLRSPYRGMRLAFAPGNDAGTYCDHCGEPYRAHFARSLDVPGEALEPAIWEPAVCSTAGGRRASVAIGGNGTPKGHQGRDITAKLRNRSLAEECELQGLPPDFLADAPFTARAKRVAVGNGVPLQMGRAVARAVKRALGMTEAA